MLRRIAAGITLALALAVPMTGCGSLTGGGSNADGGSTGAGAATSPSPSVDAAKVLTAAVTKTSRVNVKAVLAGDTRDQDITAQYDAHSKLTLITGTLDGDKARIVVTATDMYLSGISGIQGTTVRVRMSKLRAASAVNIFTDLLAPLHILGHATDLEQTAPGTFAGKLDLTKVSTNSLGTRKFLDYVVSAGGDKVKSLDFNATVNSAGYLTQFDVTLPKIDDGKDSEYKVDFSEFGKPVSVKKPTSGIIEAPAALYGS